MELEVPVFKFVLNEGLSDSFLPQKANETDTGWDVRSAKDYTILFDNYVKIDLGFRVFIPEGWWLKLNPRSSTFTKKHLHALYGIIDQDYFGQCIFAAHLIDKDADSYAPQKFYLEIKAGDAIGQLIPVKRQEMKVEKVSNEEFEKLCKERNATRGVGGFGSSDVKK